MTSMTIVRLLIASGILCLASCAIPYKLLSIGSQGSIACPEKNGRFAIANQCDAYIECIDGIPEQKMCPEGLLFNPEVRFNYPCGYPIDVNCEGRLGRQPAQPTEDCPHLYGYFKVGDQENCGQFVNCVEGRGYIFDCPEGLAFNSESYRCDWPDQVQDCDAEAYLGFKCPDELAGSEYKEEMVYFRNSRNCQTYFICLNGKPRMQNCGPGMAFNELINSCDFAENVAGCESIVLAYQNGTSTVKTP